MGSVQTRHSPTRWLLAGLAVTLLAIGVFAWYSLKQLSHLRALQTETIDRNRRDSLQLLRMQANLNSVGLAIRDMTAANPQYPLYAYQAEFNRFENDLDDAFRKERKLAPIARRPEQQAALEAAATQLWLTANEGFALSRAKQEEQAAATIRDRMQPEHKALTALVSRFLVQNNEFEEGAARQIEDIYIGVERNAYIFLSAIFVFIVTTSSVMIYVNGRLFAELQSLSDQRKFLASKLITLQEEVLHSISRELHDEFGQILTAVGAMLNRAEKREVAADSPLQRDLHEVREIVQETLAKIRSLSQALHPVVIDDYGLMEALRWYTGLFERQHQIPTTFEVPDKFPRISGQPAIHAFRIAQEALNNLARHSGASTAIVRLQESNKHIRLEIEDNGIGLDHGATGRKGLGLVAMRERAAIVDGKLIVQPAPGGGTIIALEMPIPAGQAPESVMMKETA